MFFMLYVRYQKVLSVFLSFVSEKHEVPLHHVLINPCRPMKGPLAVAFSVST